MVSVADNDIGGDRDDELVPTFVSRMNYVTIGVTD
jgi:hypothetical protein